MTSMAATRKSSNNPAEIMFKIIIVGDSGTGKSCIMNRYVKEIFSQEYQSTIGTQFQSKVVQIDENYKVKLQIWDTAGQESFRSIIKSFFRNSGAVLIAYNISNRKSFQNLSQWLQLSRQSAPSSAIFVLIGTHLDLEEKREVSQDEARFWMNQNNINMFFETSAKIDLNVAKAFEEIAKQLFLNHLNKKRISATEVPREEVIVIKESNTSKTTPLKDKACC